MKPAFRHLTPLQPLKILRITFAFAISLLPAFTAATIAQPGKGDPQATQWDENLRYNSSGLFDLDNDDKMFVVNSDIQLIYDDDTIQLIGAARTPEIIKPMLAPVPCNILSYALDADKLYLLMASKVAAADILPSYVAVCQIDLTDADNTIWSKNISSKLNKILKNEDDGSLRLNFINPGDHTKIEAATNMNWTLLALDSSNSDLNYVQWPTVSRDSTFSKLYGMGLLQEPYWLPKSNLHLKVTIDSNLTRPISVDATEVVPIIISIKLVDAQTGKESETLVATAQTQNFRYRRTEDDVSMLMPVGLAGYEKVLVIDSPKTGSVYLCMDGYYEVLKFPPNQMAWEKEFISRAKQSVGKISKTVLTIHDKQMELKCKYYDGQPPDVILNEAGVPVYVDWKYRSGDLVAMKIGEEALSSQIILIPAEVQKIGIESIDRIDDKLLIKTNESDYLWISGMEAPAYLLPSYRSDSDILSNEYHSSGKSLMFCVDNHIPMKPFLRVFSFSDDESIVELGRPNGVALPESFTEGWDEGIGGDEAGIFLVEDGQTYLIQGLDGNGWLGSVNITSKFARRKDISTEENLVLTWELASENSKYHFLPSQSLSEVELWSKHGVGTLVKEKVGEYKLGQGQNSLTLEPLPIGNYEVFVETTDLMGNSIRSKPLSFQVGFDYTGMLRDFLLLFSIAYALFSFLAFLLLLSCARQSDVCFRLLTDARNKRFFPFFEFAMVNVRPVRLWLFGRYLRALQRPTEKQHAYISAEVSGKDVGDVESKLMTTEELIQSLGFTFRIWLQAGPGAGKTELIYEIFRRYTEEGSSVGGIKKFGWIPIKLELRNYSGSFLDRIQAVLRANSFPIEDKAFLESLLRVEKFAIFVDGMNEVILEEELGEFMGRYPSLSYLVTSQLHRPMNLVMREMKLLSIDKQPKFLRKLLVSFVSSIEVEMVDLAREIKLPEGLSSGYEVSLLAKALCANSELPESRMELYAFIIDLGGTDLETNQDIVVSACKQRAWELWLSGSRRFRAIDPLSTEVLGALNGRLVVLRSGEWEFAHDQLRAYLAARYLLDVVNLDITVELLGDASVWRNSVKEQEILFGYLVDLVETQAVLGRFVGLAMGAPGKRSALLEAANTRAREAGWKMKVKFGRRR